MTAVTIHADADDLYSTTAVPVAVLQTLLDALPDWVDAAVDARIAETAELVVSDEVTQAATTEAARIAAHVVSEAVPQVVAICLERDGVDVAGQALEVVERLVPQLVAAVDQRQHIVERDSFGRIEKVTTSTTGVGMTSG